MVAGVAMTLVALIVGGWSLMSPPSASDREVRPATTGSPGLESTRRESAEGTATLPDFVTGMERLPHSLNGVDPPAGLVIDAAGNLVVRRSLRDLSLIHI